MPAGAFLSCLLLLFVSQPGVVVAFSAGRTIVITTATSSSSSLPSPRTRLHPRRRRRRSNTLIAMGEASQDAADATSTPSSSLPSPLRAVQNAVGSSARGLVASAVAAALLLRRDPATYLWVAGGVLNAALSKILKRVINEARPEGARTADPGMPSSHAMSLFFLSVFVAAAAQDWSPSVALGCPQSVAAWHAPRLEALLLVGYAVTASTWRVGAGYHTRDQIAVGAGLGSLTGLSWYLLCRAHLWRALGPLFPVVPVVAAAAGGGGLGAPDPVLVRKASLRATLGLLAVGACAVGSVERRVKSWWAKAKKAANGGEKKKKAN